MKARYFCISDIHGKFAALKQVLNESSFDYEKDTLIQLGDVTDGGRRVKECVDLLLEIENRIDVAGNHDCIWALNWMHTGEELPIWTCQGGYQTLESYDFDRRNVPCAHIELFENALPYYIDNKNRVFVHGGFNPIVPIQNQKLEFLVWDRTLIKYAQDHVIKQFKHVFVGHTSTQLLYPGATLPLTFHNLTMMDCGGGWSGRLALMNVNDLDDFYLSDVQTPRDYNEPPETEEYCWGVDLKPPLMKDSNW